MNQDEKYEIETARDYVVSKSNILVQKTDIICLFLNRKLLHLFAQ